MQTIPNTIYKRAAAICEKFPTVDFLTLAAILYSDSQNAEPAADELISRLEEKEFPAEEPKTPEPLPPTEEETPNLFDLKSSKRRGRCRARFVVVNGRKYGGRNLKELLRDLTITLETYRTFKNAINKCGGNIVREARAFDEALKDTFGWEVEQFSAYAFDGRFCTVNLTNDGENAE